MSGLELAGLAITIVIAVVSGAWALVKIVVTQFSRNLDVRFALQEKARQEGRQALDVQWKQLDESQRRFERELLTLKAELPLNYVRREDHIRSETVVNAKLDAINARLDLVLERRQVQGGN